MMNQRHGGGPGRGPVFASVAVHALVLLAAWAGEAFFKPPEILFHAVEIEIFSPPATVRGEEDPQPAPVPDLVVETPDPAPPAPATPPPPPPEERRSDPPPPQREPERRPEPQPTPRPQPQPQPRPTPPPEPPREEARPSTTPDPAPGRPAESGMDIQIRMEGLRRDFPEYYAHIVTEVGRCFRWTEPTRNLAATVRFTIHRDGTINPAETRTVESSGNLRFDLTAEGAIECAGARFRPFPDDLPFDRLPIQFRFRPAGAGL